MATLLRNKPPVPPLPKEPPLPDNPPEPPLDEIAKGLARLVATRHHSIARATKHAPFERTIKQAGALQHARKQEHMQQEQVKTQRQVVAVQRAQATAKQLEPVAEAAKKSANRPTSPTGPLLRPQPQQAPVPAAPVQSHTEPQQEAPRPRYGLRSHKLSADERQEQANAFHVFSRMAEDDNNTPEEREGYRKRAEQTRATVFGGGPVPPERRPRVVHAGPAHKDTVERGPAEPKPPRPPKASTLKPPAGTVLEKPATPEPKPRGIRRTGHLMGKAPGPPPEPERSAVIPDAMEPPAAPVRGEATPRQQLHERLIGLLKEHNWQGFMRRAEGGEPGGRVFPPSKRSAAAAAQRANQPPSVAEKVAEMRATQDDPSLGYFSAAAAKIREEQEALERKKKEGK